MRAEFQARTVEDLDGVVREFAERVSRLERELKELRQQLELLGGSDDDAEASDPEASDAEASDPEVS